MSRSDKEFTIDGMEIAIEILENDRDLWKARAETLGFTSEAGK